MKCENEQVIPATIPLVKFTICFNISSKDLVSSHLVKNKFIQSLSFRVSVLPAEFQSEQAFVSVSW